MAITSAEIGILYGKCMSSTGKERISARDIYDYCVSIICIINNGIYQESIHINKSLTLKGEHKYHTIIQGTGMNDVIHITSEYVSISNLFSLAS